MKVKDKTADVFRGYLNTYSGKRLLEEHSLDEEGVWRVNGEDPNCDFGGAHSNPYLGTFSGKLRDVLEHAVTLPRFWTWGGGGQIVKTDVKPINPLEILKLRSLRDEKIRIEKRLKEINEELGVN